jgi:hypothetical protein
VDLCTVVCVCGWKCIDLCTIVCVWLEVCGFLYGCVCVDLCTIVCLCVCGWKCVDLCTIVCVCVCVRERERDRERVSRCATLVSNRAIDFWKSSMNCTITGNSHSVFMIP